MKLTEEQRKELLERLIATCREYGVSLSHEDGHGSFLLEERNDVLEAWLREAVEK
jgi:hypothetical protein